MQQIKLLVPLVTAVVLVNYLNYFQADRDKIIKDVRLLEKRIEREQNVRAQFRQSPELLFGEEQNLSRYFYPADVKESMAMAEIGQRLKSMAKSSGMVMEKLTWGEPYGDGDAWYTVLPFTAKLTGYPSDFRAFYNRLHGGPALIHIVSLMAVRDNKRKIVRYELGLAGYRMRTDADAQ